MGSPHLYRWGRMSLICVRIYNIDLVKKQFAKENHKIFLSRKDRLS